MKLQFTKQAREEYLKIVSVFAEFAGTRSANLFLERVRDRGITLLKHPEVGHPESLLSDRKRLYRSISINKNYLYLSCNEYYHLDSRYLGQTSRPCKTGCKDSVI